jgi:putative ABC transport system ATP-binding protein
MDQENQIYLENIKVTQFPEYARSKWISHIFQNPMAGTASELSILDNFRLASIRTQNKGLHFGNSVSFRQKVKETISFLGMGLENKLNQFMGNLSGGQRQALTLAMAIMDNAKVLLLDEPTAALDVKSAQIVMETAAKISKDFSLTTILVTHNLRDVVEYGNRVIQLSKGKIIRDIDKSALPELKLSEVYAWMDAVEAGE